MLRYTSPLGALRRVRANVGVTSTVSQRFYQQDAGFMDSHGDDAFVDNDNIAATTANRDPYNETDWTHAQNANRGFMNKDNIGKGQFSTAGKVITVFGVPGYLGKYVVGALGNCGATIIAATRGDDDPLRSMRVSCGVGKFAPAYINIDDEESVRDAMKHSDVVINCMTKHYETTHYHPSLINCSFEDVHVKGAERLARIAREEYVDHFVHVSHLSANEGSRSQWSRTKAQGECVVREQFPGAVVVRPSHVYGEGDKFLGYHAMMAERFKTVPLVDGGRAVMYPTFVADAAIAIAKVALNYSTVDQTYDLYNPLPVTRKQLYDEVFFAMRRDPLYRDVSRETFESINQLMGVMPEPWSSLEFSKAMTEDEIINPEHLTYQDLEIEKPVSFFRQVKNHLALLQPGGLYNEAPRMPDWQESQYPEPQNLTIRPTNLRDHDHVREYVRISPVVTDGPRLPQYNE